MKNQKKENSIDIVIGIIVIIVLQLIFGEYQSSIIKSFIEIILMLLILFLLVDGNSFLKKIPKIVNNYRLLSIFLILIAILSIKLNKGNSYIIHYVHMIIIPLDLVVFEKNMYYHANKNNNEDELIFIKNNNIIIKKNSKKITLTDNEAYKIEKYISLKNATTNTLLKELVNAIEDHKRSKRKPIITYNFYKKIVLDNTNINKDDLDIYISKYYDSKTKKNELRIIKQELLNT